MSRMALALAEYSDDQLRDMALTADALLLIDATRRAGLVCGGPEVDAAVAEAILDAAARRPVTSWTDHERIDRALELAIALSEADEEEMLRAS